MPDLCFSMPTFIMSVLKSGGHLYLIKKRAVRNSALSLIPNNYLQVMSLLFSLHSNIIKMKTSVSYCFASWGSEIDSRLPDNLDWNFLHQIFCNQNLVFFTFFIFILITLTIIISRILNQLNTISTDKWWYYKREMTNLSILNDLIGWTSSWMQKSQELGS